MSILNELIEYANNCLNDKFINEYEDYISCEKHKWACQRFLNDVKKQNLRVLKEEFPYYWDEGEAKRIVKWFTYLRHRKGVLAGQPIILNSWQKFFVCQIYGWRRKEDDLRRFKKSFVEVARKNAKSQLESGIALYELSCGSTKNNELYEINCAGVKRKQSKVVFDECKYMLKGSKLKAKFKITRDSIIHRKTESVMTPLCKEDKDKGDGGNPALFIIDEYHQHPTSEFYDLGAYGANTKEPLLMIITTAGKDLTFPCYTQEYKYCSSVLNPNVDVENDEYFIDILELDKKDDIEDERNWRKANPIRMTYKAGVEKIRGEYKIAKEIPEKMPGFLTKCLNVWVQAKENGYMNMEKWKLCEVDKIPYDLFGRVVFVGFDMSSKIDLTSVAFIIPVIDNGVKKYICFSHSFMPNREKLVERTRIDKVPYEAWERNGWLTVTNTDIVDQSVVMNYVLDTCKKYNWHIEQLCFDPANASKLMLDLENEGFPVVEVFQSHKSLNESTVGFREQVYCKNIVYTFNPLLNFAMSNAVIAKRNGLIKIDKDATKQKIDPVDAMLAAFKLALYYEPIDITSTDEWLDSDEW
ncbi:terminase large subunit [Clostridium perfringens]|nr:terminase large subunit [Clostridium perfringens]